MVPDTEIDLGITSKAFWRVSGLLLAACRLLQVPFLRARLLTNERQCDFFFFWWGGGGRSGVVCPIFRCFNNSAAACPQEMSLF